jgi:hypothetical protein
MKEKEGAEEAGISVKLGTNRGTMVILYELLQITYYGYH